MNAHVPLARPNNWTWGVVFAALPILGVAYQLCAERTAMAMLGEPFGLTWLVHAAALPWAQGLVALEVASFCAWMYVLSKAQLSAAFPLTAMSYILVIGLSWFVLHEPASLMQVIGAVAILIGVWLARPEPDAHP